jgi:hypothetical protein
MWAFLDSETNSDMPGPFLGSWSEQMRTARKEAALRHDVTEKTKLSKVAPPSAKADSTRNTLSSNSSTLHSRGDISCISNLGVSHVLNPMRTEENRTLLDIAGGS